MKRFSLTLAAILISSAAFAAGHGQPGSHFITNWDANEDGQVTLEEASEKRGDIFLTFDAEDDGFLSASDYAMFDEARAADHASEGKGQGQGQGGKDHEEGGMTMKFNDVDGDGQVSLDEFTTRTADWFATMDRNGDGAITTDDFGPKG